MVSSSSDILATSGFVLSGLWNSSLLTRSCGIAKMSGMSSLSVGPTLTPTGPT